MWQATFRRYVAKVLSPFFIFAVFDVHDTDLPPQPAQSHEIPPKFKLIGDQGHSRSSILVSIESACDFLLVINSNLDVFPAVVVILMH